METVNVGDVVTWKGVGPLVVTDIREDGAIFAYNRTLQLTVSGPDQLDAVVDHA